MDKLSKLIEIEEQIAYLEYQLRVAENIHRPDKDKLVSQLLKLEEKRDALFTEV